MDTNIHKINADTNAEKKYKYTLMMHVKAFDYIF